MIEQAIAGAYALFVIGSSLVIYFKFIDRPLDHALDRAFASWHKSTKRKRR